MIAFLPIAIGWLEKGYTNLVYYAVTACLLLQFGNTSSYVDRLIESIKVETKTATQDPNKSALIAIKISIERALEELANPKQLRKLLKMLSYLAEKNLSPHLLVACAETYIPDMAMVWFLYFIRFYFNLQASRRWV